MTTLKTFIRRVDRLNDAIGKGVAWGMLGMTLVTLAIVFFVSVFRQGAVWTSELVVYLHAILFMLAAAHTLRHDEHVRIDAFYSRLSAAGQARVNLGGVFLLLIPACAVILFYAVPYVAASWAVRETSPETEGLPLVFVLKTCLVVMPVLLILQGLAMAARSWLILGGDDADA